MYHPWREIGRLADWTIRFVELPVGILGLTLFASQEVLLAKGQLQVERRSTIAHELEHILAGPASRGCHGRAEEQARRNAAQKLLPDVRQIADALAWAGWRLDVAADELWVDEATLADRLRFMTHPAERAYLQRRFEEHHA